MQQDRRGIHFTTGLDGQTDTSRDIHTFQRIKIQEYRDALKGGPVLLSNSQARPGRNFSQPRAQPFSEALYACGGGRRAGIDTTTTHNSEEPEII